MSPKKEKRNAEEGGRSAFWGNDINSKEDDNWAKEARKIIAESKKLKNERKTHP